MTAQEDPYVRVYYRALTDDKFQGLSSAAWGHWVRMLVVADGMHPSAAPLPRWVERKPLQELVSRGIVDLEGTEYFRIHGMEPERAKRTEAATFAAEVKHHGLAEAQRRQAARLANPAGAVQPHAGAAPGAPPQPPGRAVHASPNHSEPSLSEPLRAENGRAPEDGQADEPYRTVEELTRFPAQRFEANAIRALDALCDRRTVPTVVAALREVAPSIPTQPPSPWQLVSATVKHLEPFTPGRPAAAATPKGSVQGIDEIREALRAQS